MTTAGMIAKTVNEVSRENAIWESVSDRAWAFRMDDNDISWEFAAHIVKATAKEYEDALMSLLRSADGPGKRVLMATKAECEAFFLSPTFEVYMPHTDGKAFMKQVRKNAAAKAKHKAVANLKKAKRKAEEWLLKGE